MAQMKVSRTGILAAGLLVLLTLAAYWPVLGHGFISYDDPDYVTENPHVLAGLSWATVGWAFETREAANWHPVTWLSHALDARLYGLHATGHHLTSLLLHAANALVLLFLLYRLTGAWWRSAGVAALFALHPLHVESVAWVAERKDVLSAFFFLVTLWAYVHYAHLRELQGGNPKAVDVGRPARSFWYGLAVALFALGLLCKPMVVTLPFVLWLLDYWPLGRFRGKKLKAVAPLALEKIPFLLLAAAASLVTMHVQKQGGTVSSLGDYPLLDRLQDVPVAYLKYLGKALWPANLAVYYPHPALNPGERWPVWQVIAATLVLVGVSVLAVRRRKQAGWFAVGWFWYLGMLVPVIGVVQAGNQAMADRYTYLPLIGAFLSVVYGLGACLAQAPRSRVAVATAGVMLVLICAGLTRHQVNYWKDDVTLFGHALAVNPRNAPACHTLGWEWARQGKYGLARVYCQAAVQADPSTYAAWHTLGDVATLQHQLPEAIQDYQTALRWNPQSALSWFKLGSVQASLGHLPEAIQDYREALRFKPTLVAAHTGLGVALGSLGKRAEAIQEFTEAVHWSPESADKHYNLGTSLVDAGHLAEGEAQLTDAVRLKPDSVEALTALAGALAQEGRGAEAQKRVAEAARVCGDTPPGQLKLGTALLTAGLTNQATAAFAEARRLEPNLTQLLLASGQSFLARGELEEAAARFQALVWLEPHNAETHERLGLLLANEGKLAEAIAHLQAALRLGPTPERHYNLALLLGMQGSLAEAVAHYQQVLQAKPDSAPALNDLAWIRATAPQAELRDGAEAVQLAERACQLSDHRTARFLGTLAAAYAEAGRFEEAITAAEKARGLASASADRALLASLQSHLTLFRSHQPCRQ